MSLLVPKLETKKSPRFYSLCRLLHISTVLAVSGSLLSGVMRHPGLVYFGLGVCVLVVFKRRGKVFTAFGTARWATSGDLRAVGMIGASRGPLLGHVVDGGKPPILKAAVELFDPMIPAEVACRQFLSSLHFFQKATLNPELVRMPKAVHTAYFAPTGVGKGVSCIIPFLLTSDETVVVVDFKGENFHKTAEHRKKLFKHKIVVVDPFCMVSESPDTFNPLDSIDRNSPTAIDEVRAWAGELVLRTGRETDPHWISAAETWIAAMLALVVRYGEAEDRSLQTVRTLLTDPEKMAMAIKLMCASDAWDGMLARMGHQLTQFRDKELGSTLTTTNRFLRFLDTLAIAASTKTSSFDPNDLRRGRMTVYLVLPPEHMRAQSPLLRMWIGSLLRAVVRGGLQEERKVNFILDESASLGKMEAVDDAVDKYRGYGVRLQFYYQSMGQLKLCFPDGQDQTLLSNVSQVFFGVNDLATAEYVSNRLGEGTIVINSGGGSFGRSQQTSNRGEGSSSISTNENHNWAQHGRKLLKPEEVMALPERIAIAFTPGVPPIFTRLVRYYEDALLLKIPKQSEQFRAKTGMFAESLALLIAAAMLAIAALG